MVEFDYLYKGLCGLANAHKASALAGHLGAAVIAGYFWGEDLGDLDGDIYRGVERELDRVMKGEEAFWFNSRKAGVTAPELFKSLPDEEARQDLIPNIANALSANIGKTRQSGHNVIFAGIAIRALHDHPQYATPAIVGGICKLIEGFNGVTAGRGYYGQKTGWKQGEQVELSLANNFPIYRSQQEMVEIVIDELIASVKSRKQGYGGMWHLINHTASLTELSRFGFEALARKGFAGHHQHVRLIRSLPDVSEELGLLDRSELDPRVPGYWKGELKRDEARLTHRIKTLYGFHTILQFINDDEKYRQAQEAVRFLMA